MIFTFYYTRVRPHCISPPFLGGGAQHAHTRLPSLSILHDVLRSENPNLRLRCRLELWSRLRPWLSYGWWPLLLYRWLKLECPGTDQWGRGVATPRQSAPQPSVWTRVQTKLKPEDSWKAYIDMFGPHFKHFAAAAGQSKPAKRTSYTSLS